MSELERKLQDLKFAAARAEGYLRGHVTFMLSCHDFGCETERMWQQLRGYHKEAQDASQAVAYFCLNVEKV